MLIIGTSSEGVNPPPPLLRLPLKCWQSSSMELISAGVLVVLQPTSLSIMFLPQSLSIVSYRTGWLYSRSTRWC